MALNNINCCHALLRDEHLPYLMAPQNKIQVNFSAKLIMMKFLKIHIFLILLLPVIYFFWGGGVLFVDFEGQKTFSFITLMF